MHVEGTQIVAWQAWFAAQSIALTHSTQTPSLLQTLPLPSAHGVPSSFGVLVALVPSQASTVQSRPSSRGSLASAIDATSPFPSHTKVLQSPWSCDARTVPIGSSLATQEPASQR